MLGLLVLGGLGVYAILWQQDTATREKEEKRATEAIFKVVDLATIESATLAGPAEKIKFSRDENREWKIVAPIEDAADQGAVKSLLRYMIHEGKRLRKVGATNEVSANPAQTATDLQFYGLAKPAYEFSVSLQSGTTETVLMGRETKFDKNIYAKRANEPSVFVMDYGLKFQYERELDGFRDKRFLELPLQEIQGITLKSEKVSWKLIKKDNSYWLAEPISAPADPSRVAVISHVLESLEIKTFVDAPLAVPDKFQDKIELTLHASGAEPTTLTLYKYQEGSTTHVYALGTGAYARKGQAMLQVDGSLSRLKVEVNALEDRRVARFEREDVHAVRIFSGEMSLHFENTQDGFWRMQGEQRLTKPGVIQGILHNLRRLTASRSGVQNPDEKALEEAGLTKKAEGIELIGPKGESVATVYLGKAHGDNQWVLSASGRLDTVAQAELSQIRFHADDYLEVAKID